MKTSPCSLIAIISFALSSAVFAASAEEHQMTGTVVEGEFPPDAPGSGSLTIIETATKHRVEFNLELGSHGYKPKVGEKVTVHYDITPRGKWIARQIEKAGKGSKKR